MKGASYVINLKRRTDRKEKFLREYDLFGPRIPLHIIDAVDGTDPDRVTEHRFYHCTSDDNDYEDNPRVRATILSHMQAWEAIAKSDLDYGLVFEDDIIFREDGKFKMIWSKMIQKFPPKFIKDKAIIYFGAGDCLPIHTNPPTLQLLRAQEKSHATTVNNYFGKPRKKSAYIFDWFGAFSYILSPRSAQYLLDLAAKEPLHKAVDVWVKQIFDEGEESKENFRYVTIPLLTYHGSYELVGYDSDTWGISIPYKTFEQKTENKKKISFLIPTRTFKENERFVVDEEENNDSDAPVADPMKRVDRNAPTEFKERDTRRETLERVIDSIEATRTGALDIEYVIRYDDDDEETEDLINELKENSQITIVPIKGPRVGKLNLHQMYNEMKEKSSGSLLAIWDDDTIIITKDWDEILARYYEILLKDDPNAIASFQPRSRDTWIFRNPILTRNFYDQIREITVPSIEGFIKMVGYLSRTNVMVRDIHIEKVVSEIHPISKEDVEKIIDLWENNPDVKTHIEESVKRIRDYENYLACGVWTKTPEEWHTSNVIGKMSKDLAVFNKETI